MAGQAGHDRRRPPRPVPPPRPQRGGRRSQEPGPQRHHQPQHQQHRGLAEQRGQRAGPHLSGGPAGDVALDPVDQHPPRDPQRHERHHHRHRHAGAEQPRRVPPVGGHQQRDPQQHHGGERQGPRQRPQQLHHPPGGVHVLGPGHHHVIDPLDRATVDQVDAEVLQRPVGPVEHGGELERDVGGVAVHHRQRPPVGLPERPLPHGGERVAPQRVAQGVGHQAAGQAGDGGDDQRVVVGQRGGHPRLDVDLGEDPAGQLGGEGVGQLRVPGQRGQRRDEPVGVERRVPQPHREVGHQQHQAPQHQQGPGPHAPPARRWGRRRAVTVLHRATMTPARPAGITRAG